MRIVLILASLSVLCSPALAADEPVNRRDNSAPPSAKCTRDATKASSVVVYDPNCKRPFDDKQGSGNRAAPDSPTGADTGSGGQSGTMVLPSSGGEQRDEMP